MGVPPGPTFALNVSLSASTTIEYDWLHAKQQMSNSRLAKKIRQVLVVLICVAGIWIVLGSLVSFHCIHTSSTSLNSLLEISALFLIPTTLVIAFLLSKKSAMTLLVPALTLVACWPRGAVMAVITHEGSPGGWSLSRSTPFKNGNICIYTFNPEPISSYFGHVVTFEKQLIPGIQTVSILATCDPSTNVYVDTEGDEVTCYFADPWNESPTVIKSTVK